jgi:leucine dehydrogenase
MELFNMLESYGHEQVIFCSDKKSGLKAIIGIHNTVLGPALGGTRMWQYASDAEALTDVLRLSRGMTYKAAVAGLNLGGGKAVIIGDSRTDKTEALFRAYGRAVEAVGGRYITAEDVGTSVKDMEWIGMETNFVTGVSGQGGSGDPSPFTAYGVYHGIKACAKVQFGTDSLAGKKIAVQGAGNVATHLIGHLIKEGAKVFVTDIYTEKALKVAAETGAEYVIPEKITTIDCDIFSPNALGAILNDETIPNLKCGVVAGGANNQLADEKKHAEALRERGIIYAPDYVINAGGLMNVASEIDGYSKERVLKQAEGIYTILTTIFKTASARNILSIEASNAIAEERIAAIGHIHGNYIGKPDIRR